jgi:hypothetical protein
MGDPAPRGRRPTTISNESLRCGREAVAVFRGQKIVFAIGTLVSLDRGAFKLMGDPQV